jgi:4-hydroxy-tetrahydrodipicolinate synthase
MNVRPAIRGSGAAIITPFDSQGKLDKDALKRLVDFWARGGLDVLVVLGTTGESVTLSKEEKQTVIDLVIEHNQGRCALMLGIGGNNTSAVADEIAKADLKHFEAVLSVAPYYNKPTQEGLFQHYKVVSQASSKPVLLYNVPGRTGSNMTAETTIRIANECPNVCGIKEASGNMEQIMQIIRQRPEHFLVLSGDDALTLPIMAAGGDGVISVVANAFPTEFSQMVHALVDGNLDTARKYHYQLLEFTRLIFTEGNPAGVKAALKILGLCDETVRLPLMNVSASLFGVLEHEIKHIRHNPIKTN